MKRTISIITLIIVAASVAFADIARPDRTPNPTPKPKQVSSDMEIIMSRDRTEATLVIPKTQLKALRAQLDELDSDSDATAAVTTGGISRVQTLISGLFLSLAILFAGVWFFRNGKSATKTGKTLVILAVFACLGSAATLVLANVGPPPGATVINSKIFSDRVKNYGTAYGKIKMETGSDDRVKLYVPVADDKPAPANGEE